MEEDHVLHKIQGPRTLPSRKFQLVENQGNVANTSALDFCCPIGSNLVALVSRKLITCRITNDSLLRYCPFKFF